MKILVRKTYDHLNLNLSTIKAAQQSLLKILELDDSSIFEKARLALQSGVKKEKSNSVGNNELNISVSSSDDNSSIASRKVSSAGNDRYFINNNKNININNNMNNSRNDKNKNVGNNGSGRSNSYFGLHSSVLDRRMSKGKHNSSEPAAFSIRNSAKSSIYSPKTPRADVLKDRQVSQVFKVQVICFSSLLLFLLLSRNCTSSVLPSFLPFLLPPFFPPFLVSFFYPSFLHSSLPSFPPSFLPSFLPSFFPSLLPFFLSSFFRFY